MGGKKLPPFHRGHFAGFDNSLLDLLAIIFFLNGQDASFSFGDEEAPPSAVNC